MHVSFKGHALNRPNLLQLEDWIHLDGFGLTEGFDSRSPQCLETVAPRKGQNRQRRWMPVFNQQLDDPKYGPMEIRSVRIAGIPGTFAGFFLGAN